MNQTPHSATLYSNTTLASAVACFLDPDQTVMARRHTDFIGWLGIDGGPRGGILIASL